MDNTRVISPNGTSYGMPNEKMLKSSGLPLQKNGQRCDLRKGVLNTGPIYNMCSGNEAQILMNSQSIFAATTMQFLEPPKRNKSTLCSSSDIVLPHTQTVNFLKQATFVTQPTSAVLFASQSATVTARTVADLSIEKKSNSIFITNPRTINVNHKASGKFFNDSPLQPPTEGRTIVSTFKSIINNLLKPIFDMTTMIVGSDSNVKPTSVDVAASSDQQQMFWGDSDNSPKNKNHDTMPMYSDNRSSGSFCYSSESANIYMNFMPETYFDCDDYIDGGEDTIDFVADSTKDQWQSFGDEFDDASIQPLLKNCDSFDCINKADIKSTEKLAPVEHEPERELEREPKREPERKQELQQQQQQQRENESKIELSVESPIEDETVQYKEAKVPINCPKYEKPKRNYYRRKRKAKRKHKSTNGHNKAAGANKNRHEKIRHEVAMNIHDDINDCTIVNGANASSYSDDFEDQEQDFDLEIIDVDDDNSPKSRTMSTPTPTKLPTSTKSTMTELKLPLEMPIPSPEIIPSGCMFTRFFRFDRPCKGKKQPQQPTTLRCMQKQVPQIKVVKEERPTTSRRSSETESDDSFIIFEECSPRSMTSVDDLMSKQAALKDSYRRQRQISECSDDFILFEDDVDDCSRRYDTTDEDFTDSTDDSDSSEDGT